MACGPSFSFAAVTDAVTDHPLQKRGDSGAEVSR